MYNHSKHQVKYGAAPLRNLVFEGGGMLGIAYVGSLLELERREALQSLENVAGASAGAICAFLLAAGYTPTEMAKELKGMDWAALLGRTNIVAGSLRLLSSFGWHEAKPFEAWLGTLLIKKGFSPSVTFRELYANAHIGRGYPALWVLTTSLSYGTSVVFSRESTPEVSVVKAVRASIAIPFLITPVELNGELHTDGGLLNNYPIRLFDLGPERPNPQTMGFRVDGHKELLVRNRIAAMTPTAVGILDFCRTVVTSMYRGAQDSHLTASDWERTILIDTAYLSALNFAMTHTQTDWLIETGSVAVVDASSSGT